MRFFNPDRVRICGHRWEIEAARDGRLNAAAHGIMLRHIQGCASCGDHQAYVEGLARAVRVNQPAEPSELSLKALRGRTLASVDAALVADIEERASLWQRGALVASLLLCSSVALARFFSREVWSETTILVDAEQGTRWSRRSEGDTVHVALDSGRLWIRVQHGEKVQHLVVHTPDGEVEDIGTMFGLWVENGRTTRVQVDEGRVELRRRNQGALTLDEGESWESGAAREARAEAPSTSVALSASSSAPASRTLVAPLEVSGRFAPGAAAMRAAPAQSRAEDWTYLGVLQLLNEGKIDAARVAANLYLQRFPDGFRREEMGRVAR